MGAVNRTKGFLYKDFTVFSQLFGKFGIVLFFFGVVAEVFQKGNFAVFGFGYYFIGFRAYAIFGEMHRYTEQFFHFGGHGSQTKFRYYLAFRAAQVGN